MSETRKQSVEKNHNKKSSTPAPRSTGNLLLNFIKMSFKEKCLIMFTFYLCLCKDPIVFISMIPFAAAASAANFKAERNDHKQFSNPQTICTYAGLPTANKPNITIGLDDQKRPIPESCITTPKSDRCVKESKELTEYKRKNRGYSVPKKLTDVRNNITNPNFHKWWNVVQAKGDELLPRLTAEQSTKFLKVMAAIRIWGMKFFNAAMEAGIGGCGEQTEFAGEKFIKWANTHRNRKLVLQEVDVTVGDYTDNQEIFENHLFLLLDSGIEEFLPGKNMDDPENSNLPRGKSVVQDVMKRISPKAMICDPWNQKYAPFQDDQSRLYKSDLWKTITVTTIPLRLDLTGLPQEAVESVCDFLREIDFARYVPDCKPKKKNSSEEKEVQALKENVKSIK